jgi:hypothetical protein
VDVVIRWFINLLYGSVPADFESAFDLDQSVRRLASATGRSVFSALFQQRAVGKVSASGVSIQRVIPLVGNSFKPYFVGAFQDSGHRVILSGRFTMHWCGKVFMSVWFGGCVLWTIAAVTGVLLEDLKKWWVPFIGVGMICAGIAMVWVGKWFARNDIAWLSRVIQEALGVGPPNSALQTDL